VETMRSLYTRPQRQSIYHPATIGDIPQEVLEYSLILLLPSIKDLFAAGEACRAWRPVAQKIIHSRIKFANQKRTESLLCGYRLHSLVYGSESFQISTLTLSMGDIGRCHPFDSQDNMKAITKEYIPLIARLVAPTLSSLDIVVWAPDISYDCETLETFFSCCHELRNLRLSGFEFGDDPAAFSSKTIKDGFSRLDQLNIDGCLQACLFIENSAILNLKSFSYSNETGGEDDEELVNLAIEHYGGSLVSLHLDCNVSSDNLIKIADKIPTLVDLKIGYTKDGDEISLPAIEAISSLPHLKRLKTGPPAWFPVYLLIADGAVSAFARCHELKHLSLRCENEIKNEELKAVLCGIGGNLDSLALWGVNAEVIDMIVKNCGCLRYLELEVFMMESDEVKVEAMKQKLKSGLKMLAKLKLNGVSVRLGSDWDGIEARK
jgi:hypothetical protein